MAYLCQKMKVQFFNVFEKDATRMPQTLFFELSNRHGFTLFDTIIYD